MSAGSPRLNVRQTGSGIAFAVRLTPRSARDAIEGVGVFGAEAALIARVRAIPEDGRANAALERLIAKWLGVPKSSVAVVQGGRSRLKQIAIEGDSAALAGLAARRLEGF